MRTFIKFIGFGLLIWSVYLLGHNIFFTTNASPYFWRGIAADASVICLAVGVLCLVFCPKEFQGIGWFSIILGILCVFVSSRAILSPTSLWEFFISFVVMAVGYKMLTTGRVPLI
ncbi:MAG: hypothetical protein AAFQ63_08410 [Cyanobacteria bacterium J06621_11]